MKTIACPHWSDCGVTGGGCCALGKYGGRPSLGTCHIQCLKLGEFPAGDLAERIARAVGVDRLARMLQRWTGPCHCMERRAKLNRLDARLHAWLARKAGRSST